ncbi:MAG TPA: hypothetical protein DD416_03510 [Rhodobacteraceae bacterium]|jgi:zinc transport system permease protein|nr:hypothetical protein [Paracoccaceae bacterium]
MITTMIMRGIRMDEFLWRVVLAATGVALAAGPLGCFVVWRRMVYFGDTISHAALLGVAFALASGLPVFLGVLLCALAIAAVILLAEGRLHHTDTLLGVSAHSALALGLVAVAFLNGVKVDLMSYLIGDILAVNWQDVAVVWTGAIGCLGLLIWRWRPLLVSSLDREMALAHGQNPRKESIIFTLALAILVAAAIKVVGALLITALLIIPAATGRLGGNTPEKMAVMAALAAVLAALLGLFGSFQWDTPTGPSVVVAALFLLILASLVTRIFRPR